MNKQIMNREKLDRPSSERNTTKRTDFSVVAKFDRDQSHFALVNVEAKSTEEGMDNDYKKLAKMMKDEFYHRFQVKKHQFPVYGILIGSLFPFSFSFSFLFLLLKKSDFKFFSYFFFSSSSFPFIGTMIDIYILTRIPESDFVLLERIYQGNLDKKEKVIEILAACISLRDFVLDVAKIPS